MPWTTLLEEFCNKLIIMDTGTHVNTFPRDLIQPNETIKSMTENCWKICGLCAWRHHLQGAPYQTIIVCDHKNLLFYCKPQWLTSQQWWWVLELSTFPYFIYTAKGIHMTVSNTLSHNPSFLFDQDTSEEYVILLSDHLFIKHLDLDLETQIQKSYDQDTMVWDTIQKVQQDTLSQLWQKLED